MTLTLEKLEQIYKTWNRPEYIPPDPLETLAPYTALADREVAALLAASLAYGRVNALLVPLRRVLKKTGSSPRGYVLKNSETEICRDLSGIVYRFARPEHLAALLAGIGRVIKEYGSLEEAFLTGYQNRADELSEENCILCGLSALASALREGASESPGHLLSQPSGGSACKRLFLFLRWMVRRDNVDPGGWNSVDPAHLLPPLDTWTYRIALRAGWTQRRSADLKTVLETGAALRKLNPRDPVRYDFALSRFGIRSGLTLENLFEPDI